MVHCTFLFYDVLGEFLQEIFTGMYSRVLIRCWRPTSKTKKFAVIAFLTKVIMFPLGHLNTCIKFCKTFYLSI